MIHFKNADERSGFMKNKKNKRSSGIIMHISSLPDPYGIGRMGRAAYDFVDWLEKAGQRIWQILPLSPTSFGDSPYQSFSVNAGNPYFIDLETLEAEGLLKKYDYADIDWGQDNNKVDYEKIFTNTFPVLKIAYENFIVLCKENTAASKDFSDFRKNNPWVSSYGLFMALKNENGGASWDMWDEELVFRKPQALKKAEKRLEKEIDYYAFLQYKFYEQWGRLKKYANEKGIEILGDIPIYVAYDSVEVWEQPELFYLDENKKPVEVAGCPPDYFSPLGQLWGNPIYNWDFHRKSGYKFWIERISAARSLYDIIRIDHFRGFDSYYSIPYGNKDAVVGKWNSCVGIELFKAVKAALGDVNIVAEDLGFITKSVERLLKKSGYPGMKVLEFGFEPGGKSTYLPHNFKSSNCVCYTGTHDNDTVLGWAYKLKGEELKFCKEYLGVKNRKAINDAMIRLAWSSIADTAIAQMQDLLALDGSARMNVPSTIGTNWQWRAESEMFTEELALKLKKLTEIYNRI